MRDISLKGTSEVYRFTLVQLLKSKGSITTIVLMLVMSFVIIPIASLTSGEQSDTHEPEIVICDADNVYINNNTPLDLSLSTALSEKENYPNTEFHYNSANVTLGEYDYEVNIDFNDGYSISIDKAENSLLSEQGGHLLANDISSLISDAIYAQSGLTEEQISELMSGYSIFAGDADEFYLSSFDETAFILQYIYSIALMMFGVMSVSYIVRAVVEEKASKLVELLMVSVKPLALILGKILAIATYGFGIIALMIASFFVSSTITNRFSGYSASDLFATMGFSDISVSVGTVIVVVLSFIIAYMTVSLLAGIMGTACSSTEDMQSSTLSVTMIVMAGYLVSCIVSAFDGAVAYATSLIPIVSAFCAPVNYLMGKIDLVTMIASLLIQLLILIALAYLCAKVYRELIVYNGKRIKFSEIIKMAKTKGGKANV